MKTRSRRRSRATRFRPRVEALESRRVLAAAIDLASINGLVFDDVSGNGYDTTEEVADVPIDLYRDDGDGLFEPTSGDTPLRMTMTGDDGRYSFQRLTAGSYFVQQPAYNAAGHSLPESVSPLIVISSTDVQGVLAKSIDTFDTGTQVARDDTMDGQPVTSTLETDDAIGGERDLFVNKTSANGEVQLSANSLQPDRLSFDSISGGNGERRISWDGIDRNASVIDDTGLSGSDANLSSNALGVGLQVGADLGGGTAVVRLYSDDGNPATAARFSSAMIPLPVTGGSDTIVEFIPFSDFTASGGGAILDNVGAIELEITGAANINGTAELVGTVGPRLFTHDFDNFESADLSISKSVSDATPTTNQNVTFTVTVSNAGPDNATGVVVTDQLPGGVTYVSHSPSTESYNPTTGIWTLGSLNNAGSATLSIVGRVDGGGIATNRAEITSADQSDPNTGNNQSSTTVTPETIDIAVTKQVNNPSPNIGDTVTFTITAFNAGPSNATGVSIRDVLPPGLTFSRASQSQGTYSNATGVWTVGNINSGANATLSIFANVVQNGPLTNAATLVAADQTDTNPGNNEGSIGLAAATADLSLNMNVSSSVANVGDSVTFTITLANAGPNAATGVTVTDQLPAGTSFISASPSQGNYDPSSGVWTVGSVPIGSTPSLDITARIDTVGTKTNTAQVSGSDQSDPNSAPGNNQPGENDQDSSSVMTASADLSLTQDVDNTNPNVGGTVTFTVNLANAGPDTATSIVVRDVLPTGLTFVSATPSPGQYDSNTGLWSVGSLPRGSTASMNLVARVDTTSPVTNTARVESVDQFDINSTPGNDAPAENDQDAVVLTPASADLSLTKLVSDANPSVGDQVTFTITVTNIGPNAATGVTVLDQLPLSTTFVSETPTQGDYNQTSGIWTIGTIPVGGTVTLSLVATANTTGLASNSAHVMTSDQKDPDSIPGNNNPTEDDQATAEIEPQQIDLELAKTVSDMSPNVGTDVTFVITLRNKGPNTATGVMVTESLPRGVTLRSSTPSQGGFNLSNGVWTVGSLAANNTATISLVARVDDPGTGINTAQVTAADQSDIDSIPGNNNEQEDDQASISFTTPIADLSLDKSVSNSLPNVGDRISFNLRLMNNGPDDATGISVSDTLPAGLTFISNNLSAGSYDSASGVWDVGGLANGAEATLEIIARVDTQGAKTNTARVLSSDQSDPNSIPGNDVESENDQDSVSLTPAIADLSITKTASTSRPAIGDQVVFTVTVDNDGPNDATGIQVVDALPNGLSFVSANPVIGAYDAGTGLWNVGSLAASSSAALELTARVDTLGEKTNKAEVTAVDQFDDDSTPGNNDPDEDDQASIIITPASADLSLRKTVDDASPNVGDIITYTLTVNSEGPDTTDGVKVRDTLPAGMTFQSATPSIGTYDSATRVWTIGSLAANRSATLEIRAMVDTPGDKSNSAEIIASSQLDPDSTPDNNIPGEDDQSSAELSPELVDLALKKSLSNDSPNIGDTITYTLELSNDGPTTATGVAVTDQLPSGVNIVGATPTTGTYNPSTGVWNVDEVAVGSLPKLTITATVGNTGGETNTAEITAIDQPDSDSTPGNNVPGEDDQASTTFVTQVADLAIRQVVDNATPNMTETVNFTINLFNAGPDHATDVVVRDLLPSGLRFVDSSPSVGSYDPATGQWTIARVPNGSTAVLNIEAAVTSIAPATNVAEVFSSRQIDPDSVPGNSLPGEDDYAEASVTPQVVDVSVSGSVNNDAPLVGDTIQIVFTVSNVGPAAATNLSLHTLLPSGLSLISSQPQTGSYDSLTGQWDAGNLAAGTSTQLVLNARVDERGARRVPIELISADQFDVDSTPGNGSDIEDDQTEVLIRAPRLLNTRLFMSR